MRAPRCPSPLGAPAEHWEGLGDAQAQAGALPGSEEELEPAGRAAGDAQEQLGRDTEVPAVSLQRVQFTMHAEAELTAQAHNRDEI